jgi:hypothetical protein
MKVVAEVDPRLAELLTMYLLTRYPETMPTMATIKKVPRTWGQRR